LLASVLARYSRSNEGIGAILSKVDVANPDASIDRILKFVDYGHASIGGLTGGLAVALDDRLDTADVRSKVHLIFGNFVNSWTQPWRPSVRHLAEAFPIAVEAGDPQYAGYCHNSIVFQELAFGEPLAEVQAAYDAFVPFVMKANDDFTVQSFRLARQHLRALAGDTRGLGSLTDEEFDEDAWVREIRAGRNLTTLGYSPTATVRLAFLARDLATAARVGEEGWRNREALLSQICSAEVPLYYGLTLAARLRVPVSLGVLAVSSRTVMNDVG
jgi:hypothetical protein